MEAPKTGTGDRAQIGHRRRAGMDHFVKLRREQPCLRSTREPADLVVADGFYRAKDRAELSEPIDDAFF